MKKKVTITAVVIICILLGVAVALSANRAGGEIGNVKITATTGDTTATYKESFTH